MKTLRGLFRLGPAKNDHHPAVRCLIGVGVPLLCLLAIDRVDLAIFATFGAFTGAYGRGEIHRPRMMQQIQAGILLTLTVMAGELTSIVAPPSWIIILLTAAVASLGFVVTSKAQMRPTGSLFFVMAFSTIAFMTPAPNFFEVMMTASLSALLSVLVGSAGRALPGHHTPWVLEPKPALTATERWDIDTEAGLHILAVVLSGLFANAVGLGHSYWAMIASTAPLVGATAPHRVERGLQRVLGTIGGLIIVGLLFSLDMEPWQMIAAALTLQFLVELFIVRNYAIAQLFVTPLVLLMAEAARHANTSTLISDRFIETIIGSLVGIALVTFMYRVSVDSAAHAEATADMSEESNEINPTD